MAEDHIEIELVPDAGPLNEEIRKQQARKPKVKVQVEADETGTFASERQRDPSTGQFLPRNRPTADPVETMSSTPPPQTPPPVTGAAAAPPLPPPPPPAPPTGLPAPDPEGDRRRLQEDADRRRQSAQSQAQQLQGAYSQAIQRGDWQAADSVWAAIERFKPPAGSGEFHFQGHGLPEVTHGQYANMLESAQDVRQRRQSLSELMYEDQPIRGYGAGARQGSKTIGGENFNLGLTGQGEAAVNRTEPGVGANTEAAVDRLVNSIIQEAQAHAEAARLVVQQSQEEERNRREVVRARRAYRQAQEGEETERNRDFSELDSRYAAYQQSEGRQDARDLRERTRARRSWRRATEGEETERNRDFEELDRRQYQNDVREQRDTRRFERYSARSQASAFEYSLQGMRAGPRRAAVEGRVQQLEEESFMGPPPPPGMGDGPPRGPLDPEDPRYGEWNRLRGELERTPRSIWTRNLLPGHLFMQTFFGAYEASRASAAINRGELQGSLAENPLASLQAQQQAIQQAGGGFTGAIATEGLNVFGRSTDLYSPEKLERDTLVQTARRKDLDEFQKLYQQRTGEEQVRGSTIFGGARGGQIARIRANLTQTQLEMNQQIGDLKTSTEERTRTIYGQGNTLETARSITQGLPAGTWKRGEGEDEFYEFSQDSSGTYYSRIYRGANNSEAGNALNPYKLDDATRATRRARVTEMQRGNAEQQQQAHFEIQRLQAAENADLDVMRANAKASAELVAGGTPRLVGRAVREAEMRAEESKYFQDHGLNGLVQFRQGQQDRESFRRQGEDERVGAQGTLARGMFTVAGLRRNEMFQEAGALEIAQQTAVRYWSTQDPEERANIMTAGAAQLQEYNDTNLRTSRQRTRANRAAGREAVLRFRGQDLEATRSQLGEQEQEELDQAGNGLFANLFLRPGIRQKYGQLQGVAQREDARNVGLRMESLRDATETERLQSEGKTGTAAAEDIEFQALQQVHQLRGGSGEFEESRKLILQRAAYRAEGLRRSTFLEAEQGSVEQTAGGTFAPSEGLVRPWEEDRLVRLQAAERTRDKLQGLLNDPNGGITDLQKEQRDGGDLTSNVTQGLSDVMTILRQMAQVIVNGG